MVDELVFNWWLTEPREWVFIGQKPDKVKIKVTMKMKYGNQKKQAEKFPIKTITKRVNIWHMIRSAETWKKQQQITDRFKAQKID